MPFPMFLGHGIKCMTICFMFVLPSYILACVLKLWVYWAIAYALGMEPLHLLDTFWMYDTPANPINVPAFLIFKKPSKDLKLGPLQIAEKLTDRLFKLQGHRCNLKSVKRFGMWFF